MSGNFVFPYCESGGNRKFYSLCKIITFGILLMSSMCADMVQSAPAVSVTASKTEAPNTTGDFEVDSPWSFIVPVVKYFFSEEKDLTQPTNQVTAAEKVPGNCTEPSIKDFPQDLFSVTELRQGAIVLHIIAALYIFYAIAHLCEEFFVPAVNSICKVLNIPSDIAGATFMAIATSSPEFFTNVVGTFVTEGNIGVGSVVGSVVFNLLAIISWCGFAVKDGLQLEWWPLTRDCGFYVFSVLSLIAILWDGRVYWYESLLFVMAYIIYLIVICKNERIQKYINGRNETEDDDECPEALPPSRIGRISTTERLGELLIKSLSYDGFKSSCETTPLLSDKSGRSVLTPPASISSSVVIEDSRKAKRKHKKHHLHQIREVASSPNMRHAVLTENLRNGRQSKRMLMTGGSADIKLGVQPEVAVTKSWLASVELAISCPVRIVLHLTVPDCKSERWSSWYPLTFFMCILYMAIFSYLITWMMTVIGYALWIPDAVTGLTFIAAGTSLPEALSSIIVAKQGLGTMSISNSVGSNTFNILICLGLPWLIRSIMFSVQGGPAFVEMADGGFGYVSVFLVASAVILYGLIACNRFVLDRRVGFVALAMYAMFLVLASLLELNFFFPVNPPSCGQR